jgi:ABC-type transport system involved in cytochrome c biogenesis permease subunit
MAHELDSAWLYIHPPLAITGFVFIFIFTALVLTERKGLGGRYRVEFFGAAAWIFTLLGLVTGMLWAQTAWGKYWSWDPKETVTLLLFISISGSLVAYYEKRPRAAKGLAVLSCVLTLLTLSTSWIIQGLHSFA